MGDSVGKLISYDGSHFTVWATFMDR